jgi:hypothetical protein
LHAVLTSAGDESKILIQVLFASSRRRGHSVLFDSQTYCIFYLSVLLKEGIPSSSGNPISVVYPVSCYVTKYDGSLMSSDTIVIIYIIST